MKKYLIIVAVIVCALFFWYQRGVRVANETITPNTLIVFSKNGCPHCHDALSFINTSVREQFPNLPVRVLDVDDETNLAALFAVAKDRKLNLNHLGTPILILNGRTIVGWSSSSEKKLLSAIKAIPVTDKKDLTSAGK